MDLITLRKKLDGYRTSNGLLRDVPDELLLELRVTWENYKGSANEFRSELGMRSGTLRKLLVDSKKLNHLLSGSGAIGVALEGELPNHHSESGEEVTQDKVTARGSSSGLELVFDNGTKVIRFGSVNQLIEFMRASA